MEKIFCKLMEKVSEKNTSSFYFLTYTLKQHGADVEQCIKHKFYTLKRLLIKNNTFGQKEKNELFSIFEKTQKALFGFYALKKHIRNKHLRNYDYELDLNFNPLQQLPSNKIVSIIDSYIVYKFSLHDMVNIINNSLTYHYNLFAEPAAIKNPYTNLEFSLGALIQIHDAFEKSSIKTPLLFDRYYKVFFNLDLFEKENEGLIREYNIKHFMRTASMLEKHKRIKEMIGFYNRTQDDPHKIKVDKLFPKKELVDVFEKFLFTYMNTLNYGCALKCLHKRKLIVGLRSFRDENTFFGRKIIFLRIKKLKEYSKYVYNTPIFINFNNYYIPPPHLIYEEDRSYFVSERPKNVSAFSLQPYNCKPDVLIKKKDLDRVFIFENPPLSLVPQSSYVVPQLEFDELYPRQNTFFESQNNHYNIDSDDDEDDNHVFESTILNVLQVADSDSSHNTETDSDDESEHADEREPSEEHNEENTLLDDNLISETDLNNLEDTLLEEFANMEIDENSDDNA